MRMISVSICCFSNCSRWKHYGSFYLEKSFVASHDSQYLVCPSHCYLMLFFVDSFLNTLVTSAVCPAVIFKGVFNTLLYKYKELYPNPLQRGKESQSHGLWDNNGLMRMPMKGMRSAVMYPISGLYFGSTP